MLPQTEAGSLKQERERNRSERQRGHDGDGAGDADEVADEPRGRRRSSPLPSLPPRKLGL
jgi:hypothetical protein